MRFRNQTTSFPMGIVAHKNENRSHNTLAGHTLRNGASSRNPHKHPTLLTPKRPRQKSWTVPSSAHSSASTKTIAATTAAEPAAENKNPNTPQPPARELLPNKLIRNPRGIALQFQNTYARRSAKSPMQQNRSSNNANTHHAIKHNVVKLCQLARTLRKTQTTTRLRKPATSHSQQKQPETAPDAQKTREKVNCTPFTLVKTITADTNTHSHNHTTTSPPTRKPIAKSQKLAAD